MHAALAIRPAGVPHKREGVGRRGSVREFAENFFQVQKAAKRWRIALIERRSNSSKSRLWAARPAHCPDASRSGRLDPGPPLRHAPIN